MKPTADVLVDTSVWIDFFRSEQGRPGDLLDALLAEDRVLLCGVVEMEIFQGLREKELRDIQSVFEVVHYIETTREDFVKAGILWHNLRKEGRTIPSTDCLIASLCMQHNLSILSLDAHFDMVTDLKRVRL